MALGVRGLIERKHGTLHRRALHSYPTERGRAVASAVVADVIAAHAKTFGVLSGQERMTSHDLLIRVVANARGQTS